MYSIHIPTICTTFLHESRTDFLPSPMNTQPGLFVLANQGKEC